MILPSFGKIRLRLTSRYFTFDEEKRKFTLSLTSPETGEVSQNLVAVDVAKKIKERELKEYDRLLYVALTRAKLGVTLVWSEVRKDSWAERAWRPELGLQKSEGFSTLYIDSPEIKLEPWSQAAAKRGDVLLPWKNAKEVSAKDRSFGHKYFRIRIRSSGHASAKGNGGTDACKKRFWESRRIVFLNP